MLKLRNIKKDYVLKGVPTVHALKGLTVNFRRSEFVAILGASGCGKTTLLNIIGGLDRYTSGDLIIQGKSTKDYNERDWDTYRNHSIGFVFQSYNLISHQSILGNVELALTISGVEKKERRERAIKALETVGLKGMEKKKPNQLSGGQMQRVAIARALVNDPEILLADEPTGALDSETSIQIMDLLSEVSEDRLVIMVTHNPDLANQYATRIVTMKDGLITGDSDPYLAESIPHNKVETVSQSKEQEIIVYGQYEAQLRDGKKTKEVNSTSVNTNPFVVQYVNGVEVPKIEQKEEKNPQNTAIFPKKQRKTSTEHRPTNKGKKEKTSMSFFTATGLSFFNLLSKLKRTILVTIAGSIGIIGVSAVLAVSNGVSNYVKHMQDDMLSRYPLEISEQSIDYTSLMSGLASMNEKEISQFDLRTEVGLDSMINYLMDKYKDFTSVKTNDINHDLIDFIYGIPEEYVASINEEFGLDMTNNIYTKWNRDDNADTKYMSLNGLTQMYISELKTVEGFAEYAMFVDLFTDFMKQIPGTKEYVLSQYDLIGTNSHYPENPNEILLVVDENQTLTDLVYAQMGFYNEQEFLNIARKAVKTQQIKDDDSLTDAEKEEKIKELDTKYTYPQKYTIDDILGKELYYAKHDNMWEYKEMYNDICTINEKMYNLEDYTDPNGWAINSQFTYNKYTNSLEGTLSINGTNIPTSLLSITRDESGPTDPSNPFVGYWNVSVASQSGLAFRFELDSALGCDIKMNVSNTWMSVLMPVPLSPHAYTKTNEITYSGYMYEADVDTSKCEKVKIAGILKKKKNVNFGCLNRGVYYTKDMRIKMMEDSKNSQIITNASHGIKSYIGSTHEDKAPYSAYVTYTYTSFQNGDSHPIYDVPGIALALNTDFNSSLSSMFSITGRSNNLDIDKAYLRSLSGIAVKSTTTGYAFDNVPQTIQVYPKDFSCKKQITKYLDTWNNEGPLTIPNGKTLEKDDRHELSYTDTIEIIINVINTLITAITIALVAFTSLSLVVSCFMIAVITYISTMERVKEIGVIRSLGGRKKDVSRLFIAECLIIGLASGVFGIAITYLLSFIFNLSIMRFGVGNMAILTIPTALIMIGISVLLNVLSGLIPAMKASSQDPVVALRTE